MKARLVKSQYVSVADIQAEYLPISKKKIRVLMKNYLSVRMIGNRIFVERKALEELLANADTQKIDLSNT